MFIKQNITNRHFYLIKSSGFVLGAPYARLYNIRPRQYNNLMYLNNGIDELDNNLAQPLSSIIQSFHRYCDACRNTDKNMKRVLK